MANLPANRFPHASRRIGHRVDSGACPIFEVGTESDVARRRLAGHASQSAKWMVEDQSDWAIRQQIGNTLLDA